MGCQSEAAAPAAVLPTRCLELQLLVSAAEVEGGRPQGLRGARLPVQVAQPQPPLATNPVLGQAQFKYPLGLAAEAAGQLQYGPQWCQWQAFAPQLGGPALLIPFAGELQPDAAALAGLQPPLQLQAVAPRLQGQLSAHPGAEAGGFKPQPSRLQQPQPQGQPRLLSCRLERPQHPVLAIAIALEVCLHPAQIQLQHGFLLAQAGPGVKADAEPLGCDTGAIGGYGQQSRWPQLHTEPTDAMPADAVPADAAHCTQLQRMAEQLAQLPFQTWFQRVVDPAQDQLGAAKAHGHQADTQGR